MAICDSAPDKAGTAARRSHVVRPARVRSGQAGFTIMELMVVLVIAVLLLALTPPMLSSAMPSLQLKSSAREVAAAMRQARGFAVSRQAEGVLNVDLEKRKLWLDGGSKSIRVPESLSLELESAAREMIDEQRGGIRFYPDGSATGGRVTLGYGQSGYIVDLDWLTGRVVTRAVDLNGV